MRLNGGATHESRVSEVYGSPARPMGREAHLAKFRANWLSGARVLAEAAGERLIALIDEVETVRDVAILVDPIIPPPGAPVG